MAYSLWLKPAAGAPLYQKLAQEIAAQAKEHSSPAFEPHVTLLGGIDGDQDSVLATATSLAAKLQKLRLNFLDVSHGATYHRCVYILVAKEPPIMQAGQLARQEFGMEGSADAYMPHVSLLYADLDPTAALQAQAAAVQRLYGEGSDYSTLLTDTGFTAQSLSVWYTPAEDRSLGSWKQVADLPLLQD